MMIQLIKLQSFNKISIGTGGGGNFFLDENQKNNNKRIKKLKGWKKDPSLE